MNAYGGNPPEWINTFTSLFLSYFGLVGLFKLQYSITIWKFIFSFITIVGLGSVMFHATLFVGFGLTDALPMVLTTTFMAFSSIDTILYTIYRRNTKTRNIYRYNQLTNISAFLTTLFLVIAI